MKVLDEENGKVSEAVTLYHHWDGYPSAMLPLMAKAYENGRKYLEAKAKKSAWKCRLLGNGESRTHSFLSMQGTTRRLRTRKRAYASW